MANISDHSPSEQVEGRFRPLVYLKVSRSDTYALEAPKISLLCSLISLCLFCVFADSLRRMVLRDPKDHPCGTQQTEGSYRKRFSN
eukprot:3994104-Amphidinium_carterae.1